MNPKVGALSPRSASVACLQRCPTGPGNPLGWGRSPSTSDFPGYCSECTVPCFLYSEDGDVWEDHGIQVGNGGTPP